MKNFNFKKYQSPIAIGGLYFFLAAGGLWHILGVFQSLMRLLAAPLVAGLAVLAVLALLKQPDFVPKIWFLRWCAFILVASFFIEWLGVRTGVIFGCYFYGPTLQPQFFKIPLAIGGAWLVMLLAATAVWQRLAPPRCAENLWVSSLGISLLMVAFDFVMEQAAPRLDYWRWPHGIPFQNFVAWFAISFGFIQLALRRKLLPLKMPALIFHLYWAQLVYFLLVLFK
jgi:hypothetical protein